MRKHARNRTRTRGQRVLTSYTRMVALFAYSQISQNWQEWQLRTISYRAAKELVELGEAEQVTREIDGVVQIVGYQAKKPVRMNDTSPCTLTLGTTNAVANAVAIEGTRPKLSRRERDEIFRFMVWPLIGDTKAVSVRPRLTPAERHAAESLLTPVRRSPAFASRYTQQQRAA